MALGINEPVEAVAAVEGGTDVTAMLIDAGGEICGDADYGMTPGLFVMM